MAAKRASLAEVAEFIGEVCGELELNDDMAFDIQLATDEACQNAVEHACEYSAEEKVKVDVADPWVDPEEAKREYGIDLTEVQAIDAGAFDAVVLAVAHKEFTQMGPRIRALCSTEGVVFDVKSALPDELVDARL